MPVTGGRDDVSDSDNDGDVPTDSDASSSVWSESDSDEAQPDINTRPTGYFATVARRQVEVQRLCGDECPVCLASEPAHVKAQLRQVLLRRNILLGSSFLCIALFLMQIQWTIDVVAKRFNCDLDTLSSKRFNDWFGDPIVLPAMRMASYLLAQALLAMCMKWPKLWLYTMGVAAAASITHTAFFFIVEDFEADGWDIHLKCGFRYSQNPLAKRYNVLQSHMFIMLLLPRIVPLRAQLEVIAVLYTAVAYVKALAEFDWTSPEAHLRGLWFIGASFLIVIPKRRLERQQIAELVLTATEHRLSDNLIRILGYMLPPHVLYDMLRVPDQKFASHVDQASILFVEVQDFDTIAQVLSPERLVKLLNAYFCIFDEICLSHGVTKIETIGAEYVCAVGVVPQDQEEERERGHTAILASLIRVAKEILDFQQAALADCGHPVAFKMGIHTGPVVAGVVGNKLPRFRLFGDTINTAARMMQKGMRGEVQFGEATRALLPKEVCYRFRGEVPMKGKGMVATYLLSKNSRGASTRTLSAEDNHAFTGAVLECVLAQSRRWWQLRRPTEHSCKTHVRTCSRSRQSSDAESLESDPDVERPSPTQSFCSCLRYPSDAGPMSIGSQPSLHCRCDNSRPSERVGEDLSLDSVLDLQRLRFLVLLRGFLTYEREFQDWFHREVFCHELALRVNRHMAILVVVTFLEAAYLVVMELVKRDPQGTGLEFYVFCRVWALCCVCVCRAVVHKEELALRMGLLLQRLLFVMSYVVVGLVYASYACLSIPGDGKSCGIEPLATDNESGCGISSNVVLMNTLPMHVLLTSIYPFRFVPTLAGVPLTGLLVALVSLGSRQAHDFTLMSKYAKPNVVVGSPYASFLFFFFALMLGVQAWLNEKCFRRRYQKMTAVLRVKERIQGILETLMPPMVVHEITCNPCAARQHRFNSATVAQSDLVGFTELASTREPHEVVEIIGDLFGRFDLLTDHFKIYKVETVGDAYIAALAEPPLSTMNSPSAVVQFGLAMVHATQSWSQAHGENVSIRVGVHAGPCIGGIVGSKMQRYHLFGKLLHELEILESTAPRAGVQVSSSCSAAIDAELGRPGGGTAPSPVLRRHRSERSPKSPGPPRCGAAMLSAPARLEPSADLRFRLERRDVAALVTSKGEAHSHAEVGGTTYVAVVCG